MRRRLLVTVMIELGWRGLSVRVDRFGEGNWYTRVSLGLLALTLVYGDETVVRQSGFLRNWVGAPT